MKNNYQKFLLLWAGELVSSIGGRLTSFGLGVYVFQQTSSAANMALVTLLAFLPTLALSVPAGVMAEPLILDFSDSATLGIAETVCASGMLVSGLFLGIHGIKKGYVKILSLSLAVAGAAMVIMVSGAVLAVIGVCLYPIKAVRKLEKTNS